MIFFYVDHFTVLYRAIEGMGAVDHFKILY